MTCIVGYVDNEDVYIGGDSMTCIDEIYFIEDANKVFEIGPFLIGCSGDSDALDRIRYYLSVDPHPVGYTDIRYLNTALVPAIKQAISDFKDPEVNLIVGYNKNIYLISGDIVATRIMSKFVCIGSGGKYAVGALAILDKMDNLTPEQKVLEALRVPEGFTRGVKGPYYVIKQKGKT